MNMIVVSVRCAIAGQLAQRLAHQPRLQAHVLIAHLALDLGLGHERGDRVDDDQIDRAAAYERLQDVERLLSGVWLAHEQLPDVDAERAGVVHVERVLGVDERGDAARALDLGDRVQRQRRLAARFGAEDLDDAPAWIAPAAQRAIERRRARGVRRATSCSTRSPSFMIAPLPYVFSMLPMACATALSFSLSTMLVSLRPGPLRRLRDESSAGAGRAPVSGSSCGRGAARRSAR